jgi:hypothetical protein
MITYITQLVFALILVFLICRTESIRKNQKLLTRRSFLLEIGLRDFFEKSRFYYETPLKKEDFIILLPLLRTRNSELADPKKLIIFLEKQGLTFPEIKCLLDVLNAEVLVKK